MTQPTRLTLSDDSVIEFPVPLCPAYRQVLLDYPTCMLPTHDTKGHAILALRDIDDVLDIIDALLPHCTGEGETAADDLLRLCKRINLAYAQQYSY